MAIACAQVEDARCVFGQEFLLFERVESLNDFLLGATIIEPNGALVGGILRVIYEFARISVIPAA